MRWGHHALAALGMAAMVLVLGSVRGEAHKPITSPYTFNEDVYPILRDRCGKCHVSGGVGPMSLMTHQDTVPWSESIRIELMAGHMPPWGVDGPAQKFRHGQSLSARELNVVLTWASGGTPIGSSENPPKPVELEQTWPLGPPDVVLPLPEFAMTAEKQEDTIEVTLATNTKEARWLRAVDLQPGTPAIVRDAKIVLKTASSTGARGGIAPEQVLAVWVPGDGAVALENGPAFQLPVGAELLVRTHYKKTWEYERKAMTDRSSVGLYFTSSPGIAMRAITLAPATPNAAPDAKGTLSFEQTIDEDVRAVAVYPDSALANVSASLEAVRPDGSREHLITLRAQRDWARRYWFAQPASLPRGTKITVRAKSDEKAQAVATGAPPAPVDLSSVRLTLNVVPAQ